MNSVTSVQNMAEITEPRAMAEETKRWAATNKMVMEMEMAKEMEYKHIHCMLHLRLLLK